VAAKRAPRIELATQQQPATADSPERTARTDARLTLVTVDEAAGTAPGEPPPGPPPDRGPSDADDTGETVPPADVLRGLDDREVAERVAAGQRNVVSETTGRTVEQIVRANIFTRFNAILGALLVVILAVREYRDALFGIVLVLNAGIGIIQELRAKRTLDELSVVSAPRARVVRSGDLLEIAGDEIVLDDVLMVGAGDQLVVDGVVLDEHGLEVDESLLTGESDPVAKDPGDQVMSGSFVVAGSGHYQATAVGEAAYAHQLSAEAKQFSLVRSELRTGIDRILWLVQWLLIPMAGLLVVSQFRDNESVVEAVQGSVAGLAAMVPEGLVLLTSLAFAIGVIRLGKQRVLTQELAAIEGLARVDVVCLDKTGTLTEGRLDVTGVEPLGGHSALALGAMAVADPDPNASLRAIGDAFPPPPEWTVRDLIPFSSARKWSAADFGDQGTWYLGAPDILLERVDAADAAPVRERVEAHASAGQRVILLALSSSGLHGDELPAVLQPAGLVLLEERIRPDAPDTIAYFRGQDVAVKVISGDHPMTVAAVAGRVGVTGADQPVDARTLPDDSGALADLLEERSVFGRVTPEQKRSMVHALQSRDHVVAMTGDGVNDVLALKDADIGVSMGAGSAATRSVARFVLLDNSFAVFPSVVAEGRRVIANVERVANLFVTKTVYATLLALAVGVAGLPFPFFPRHLTIVSSLTIGIPAFFLALAPNARRYRPGFLHRVLRFAGPAGFTAAAATFAGYWLATESEDLPIAEARTTATIVLFAVALWVLGILARPFNAWRLWLVVSMAGAFLVVLIVPPLRNYFELDMPDLVVTLAAIGIAAIACSLLEVGWRAAGWVDRNPRLPDLGLGVDDVDVSDERFPLFELLNPEGIARPKKAATRAEPPEDTAAAVAATDGDAATSDAPPATS
jgi:cation-transporting ATPase E